MCLCSQIRTVCYGSQLVGGVLSRKAETDVSSQQLGKRLLLFSAQLSQCRTVLRLFDDLSMLAYSHSYGTGAGVSHRNNNPSSSRISLHHPVGDRGISLEHDTRVLCPYSSRNGFIFCIWDVEYGKHNMGKKKMCCDISYVLCSTNVCCMFVAGGGRIRALDIGADQRGRPAVLPL